jgi:uncharacterized protein (TIGR02444 family)
MEDFNQHSPFSQFVTDLFAKGQISSAVYHLQHRSGFNINIILYLLWLAKACYGRVTKRQVKMLESQVALWHQRVIAELKYTHALVANHADPIAGQIKNALQVEIVKAHYIEQRMLYDVKLKTRLMRRSSQQQLIDACFNIVAYCEMRSDALLPEDQTVFTQLFQVIFDTITPTEIMKQIQLSLDQFRLAADQPVQMVWREF